MNDLDNNTKIFELMSDAYQYYKDKKGIYLYDNGGILTVYTPLHINGEPCLLTQEEFINKIKTDNEFAKQWGIKIEQQELSLEERYKIMQSNISTATLGKPTMYNHEYYDSKYIPSKLISVRYNNQIIESYE